MQNDVLDLLYEIKDQTLKNELFKKIIYYFLKTNT